MYKSYLSQSQMTEFMWFHSTQSIFSYKMMDCYIFLIIEFIHVRENKLKMPFILNTNKLSFNHFSCHT